MERLLSADFAMKTGAIPDTEIDLLIAGLTQKPERAGAGHRSRQGLRP